MLYRPLLSKALSICPGGTTSPGAVVPSGPEVLNSGLLLLPGRCALSRAGAGLLHGILHGSFSIQISSGQQGRDEWLESKDCTLCILFLLSKGPPPMPLSGPAPLRLQYACFTSFAPVPNGQGSQFSCCLALAAVAIV